MHLEGHVISAVILVSSTDLDTYYRDSCVYFVFLQHCNIDCMIPLSSLDILHFLGEEGIRCPSNTRIEDISAARRMFALYRLRVVKLT